MTSTLLRPTDDVIQPFLIEGPGLRGRLVRLGPVLDQILTRHGYPEAVAKLLGETMALSGVLAGALKYDGMFTLQARGDAAVRLLVADLDFEGALRGCATFDEEALAKALTGPISAPVPRLLGNGYLAFTVDQGGDFERYQGVVELSGATLADCMYGYFRQSEQIQAGIVTACALVDGHWRAGAIMIQRLPDHGGIQPASEALADRTEQADEDWHRALTLMGSIRQDELLAADLDPDLLLFRLFHEDGVRVFDPKKLADTCRCSSERVEQVLRSLPEDSMEEMIVEDAATVTCEFCSRSYRFDRPALARLRAETVN